MKTKSLYDKSWYGHFVTKAISVRLDEEAQRALAVLEASGLSRSEAIREAILSAAAHARRRQSLREEVVALEADEDDRREMLEIAAFMESLREER
jgi:antitoxin component of RelBE/YafQ-DinJ toxin-antitoxin module